MKILIILFTLACLGLLWMRHENGNLRESFNRANGVATKQKNLINMLNNQLNTAKRQADKNEQAQVDLQGKLREASAREVKREQTITRLLNENESFRRWHSADLPDAVRRLHIRRACASAGDCLQRLPEGQPVSDAR